MALYPLILCGGSGTRLWPLSRQHYPKQFLPLAEQHTMLQATVKRLSGLSLEAPLVVCNSEHRFMVAEQLREIDVMPAAVLLEPVARNTAPAVAVAALQALKADTDAQLLVLPADHVINNVAAFQQAVIQVTAHVQQNKLVTFGIVPDSPETGYGYIQRGAALEHGAFVVQQFVEKPDHEAAQAYLAQGDFDWNSGMFLFRADCYLQELGKFQPEMLSACQQALDRAQTDLDFIRLDQDAFAACPANAIDYAVMEHTQQAVVIPLDAGWSDVGSWSALWQISTQDEQRNVLQGDVIAQDSQGCYARAEDDRLLALLGVQDLIVVDTKDALLIAAKDQIHQLKELVQRLYDEERPQAVNHRVVYRPWGNYDSVDNGARFQVKRITVNQGEKLSLQMHHHRAEHWIVVSGTAKVYKGDEEFLLHENESTYIHAGQTHRLENPGKIPLELIEVQSGSYLGEDDIVRFEDIYQRQDS